MDEPTDEQRRQEELSRRLQEPWNELNTLIQRTSGAKNKSLIHRDEAAELFMDHCRQEAAKLLASIIPPLRVFCDGNGGRPTLADVISHPLLSFDGGQFKTKSAERALLASHCYAITTAAGLDAVRYIDPSAQADVMEWMVYRLIVEEDVGAENVGRPPSPWLTHEPGHQDLSTAEIQRAPGFEDAIPVSTHVQWAPGTFEGGVPSKQKELTDRYTQLSASQKLIVLLVALKVFRPRRGVSKVLYRKTSSEVASSA